jgi:hypothetical protein
MTINFFVDGKGSREEVRGKPRVERTTEDL